MGKTPGLGRVHLTLKIAPDIKNKLIEHVKAGEAATLSDYASRAIIYYMDERPIMRELIEGLRDRVNTDNKIILEKLSKIEERIQKLEVVEGKPP